MPEEPIKNSELLNDNKNDQEVDLNDGDNYNEAPPTERGLLASLFGNKNAKTDEGDDKADEDAVNSIPDDNDDNDNNDDELARNNEIMPMHTLELTTGN